MNLLHARGLTVSLGVPTALLVVAAIWPWVEFGGAGPRMAPATPAARPVAAQALPPLASFSQTVDRPLFSPGRRRQAAAGPGVATTMLESRYRLLGIVAVGDVRRAVLGDANGRRSLEISEGAVIDGWTLKHIDVDSVTFDGPTGATTLTLRSAGPAPQAR